MNDRVTRLAFPTVDGSDDTLDIEKGYIERSDLAADIMGLIRNKQYYEALESMSDLVAMDEKLEGVISNVNLLRFSEIYAGLRNWGESTACILRLQKQVEVQIADIEGKKELDALDTMNLMTLQQLLSDVIPGRLLMYQDCGERIDALRDLVRYEVESAEKDGFRDVIMELRYNFALFSLPVALQPILVNFIAQFYNDNKSSGRSFYEISDIVFSYLAEYFTKIDPDNERYLVDICIEFSKNPDFGDSRVAKTNNQLASEERIINRARRILRCSAKFIDTNSSCFKELERIIDEFIKISDHIANNKLPEEIANFLKYKV